MNKYEEYSIKRYNSIADIYDTTPDGRFTAKHKERILDFCKVSPGDRVLDVGCGNGSLIAALSRKAQIEAYGVDISPNMIAVCQSRYPHINFQLAKGETLPFGDGDFDILTICCVLHHMYNPQAFFKEAHRVLRTGGALIIAELWLPIGLKQLADWIVLPLLKAGDNKLFSHTQLKKLYTENCFSICDVYKKGFVQIVGARKE